MPSNTLSELRQPGDTTMRPHEEPATQRDIFAQPQEARRPHQQATGPIVPADSVTGRSLTLVITIMCFLACLTAGAVYMIRQSADAWLRDIASEVTVQIEPKEAGDSEKTVQDVAAYLRRQAGIANVRAVSMDESAALLEPWLGQMDELKSLPVPRLIAVELDRNAPANLDSVKSDLEKQYPGATLDDHRRWQQQIRTITRSFALGGVAILALVAMADDGHHRIGNEKLDGIEPRDCRGSAFRRRDRSASSHASSRSIFCVSAFARVSSARAPLSPCS